MAPVVARTVRFVVDALARKNAAWRDARITLLPPSVGGQNAVARLMTGDGQLFVKLRMDARDDAAREVWAHRAAARAAPRLRAHTSMRAIVDGCARRGDYLGCLNCDAPFGGVLVVEGLRGAAPSALDDDTVTLIARATSRLHRIVPVRGPQLPGGGTLNALCAALRAALDTAAAADVVDASTARDLRRVLAQAIRTVQRRWRWAEADVTQVVCHGDLRPHNVLVHDGVARLIDFEYAGLGDAALDLMRLVFFSPLSAQQEAIFVDSYARASGDVVGIARYRALRPLGAIAAAVFGAQQIAALLQRNLASDAASVARRSAVARARLCAVLGRDVTLRTAVPVDGAEPFLGTVVVDGGGGTGKSVVASALATMLAVAHINSGAVYRALTLKALADKLRPHQTADVAKVVRWLRRARIELAADGTVCVDGVQLCAALRVLAVDKDVALWARHRDVRDAVGALVARACARYRGVVLAGQDGLRQLGDAASIAFFVDVGSEAPAQRVLTRARHDALLRRNACDRTRATAPLQRLARHREIEGGSDVPTVITRLRLALARPLRRGSTR